VDDRRKRMQLLERNIGLVRKGRLSPLADEKMRLDGHLTERLERANRVDRSRRAGHRHDQPARQLGGH
jgi:hypothetical protein